MTDEQADFTIYECAPEHDFGWVTDKDYFEDEYSDTPVATVRRRYRLLDETEMTWHPHGMLCMTCHGEGVALASLDVHELTCQRCDGDGTDPDAGTWKKNP